MKTTRPCSQLSRSCQQLGAREKPLTSTSQVLAPGEEKGCSLTQAVGQRQKVAQRARQEVVAQTLLLRWTQS